MPEPEFLIILVVAAVIFCVGLVIAALLFLWGWRRKSRALKLSAILPLGVGMAVLAPMLLLLAAWILFWIFGSSGPPTEKAVVGTYRGSGKDFLEVITIGPGPDFTFHHIVTRAGIVACDESGTVTVKGAEIRFKKFTRYIDSQTSRLLAEPEEFYFASSYFIGTPPFEMLKPWPEHDYFLRKQPP